MSYRSTSDFSNPQRFHQQTNAHTSGNQRKKESFYAVARGRRPGVYQSWDECERQVKGFSGAVYKKFATRELAEEFVDRMGLGEREDGIEPPPPALAHAYTNQTRRVHAQSRSTPGSGPSTTCSRAQINPRSRVVPVALGTDLCSCSTCPTHQPRASTSTSTRRYAAVPDFSPSYTYRTESSSGTRTRTSNIDDPCITPSARVESGYGSESDLGSDGDSGAGPGRQGVRTSPSARYNNLYLNVDSKSSWGEIWGSGTLDSERRPTLVAYCHGACLGNGREGCVAGVGVWWDRNQRSRDFRIKNLTERCPGKQTNNRAELVAIARAIEQAYACRQPPSLLIRSCSEYAVKCVTEWIHLWRRRGYTNKRGEPVKNCEIIEYVASLIDSLRLRGRGEVRVEYVQCDDPGIEEARIWSKKGFTGSEHEIVSEEEWFEQGGRVKVRNDNNDDLEAEDIARRLLAVNLRPFRYP